MTQYTYWFPPDVAFCGDAAAARNSATAMLDAAYAMRSLAEQQVEEAALLVQTTAVHRVCLFELFLAQAWFWAGNVEKMAAHATVLAAIGDSPDQLSRARLISGQRIYTEVAALRNASTRWKRAASQPVSEWQTPPNAAAYIYNVPSEVRFQGTAIDAAAASADLMDTAIEMQAQSRAAMKLAQPHRQPQNTEGEQGHLVDKFESSARVWATNALRFITHANLLDQMAGTETAANASERNTRRAELQLLLHMLGSPAVVRGA